MNGHRAGQGWLCRAVGRIGRADDAKNEKTKHWNTVAPARPLCAGVAGRVCADGRPKWLKEKLRYVHLVGY